MGRQSFPAWIAAVLALAAAAARAEAPPRWSLSVTVEAASPLVTLRGCTPQALTQVWLRAGDGAAPHLHALRRGGQAVDTDGRSGVRLRDWQAGECYTAVVDLASAARTDRFGLGGQVGEWWRIAPERWLWRPQRMHPDSTIEFQLPKGWSASVPWPALADGSGRRRIGGTPDDWPAQTAFGRFDESVLTLPGGQLRVALLPLVPRPAQQEIRDWFAGVAPALLAGDGRLPLSQTQVLIVPLPGVREPVPWGQVSRGGAAGVMLVVGADAGRARLDADWTATHELAHLQHPFLGERGRWLAEGLASYYQNVWRARTGALTAEEAWQRIAAGFERGRAVGPGPALADLGRTRGSTMRVYWSGAAYWLESDLALRAAGSSLDQALARFRDAHLPAERYWPPREFIAELDRLAPGGGLLPRLERYLADTGFPDLDPILSLLGRDTVTVEPGKTPSALSRSIMQPQGPAHSPTG
jgi:hypothetical protein